ncbi:hypothetical protein O181_035840 [Austropuccinia psidii MF-1]|uniref:Uncharacterized protein n=1 Tax=Austropuccinia psidii MF-1 TaxID=1389203 RepID=A0A9Q3D5F8_9BASI|nr:hypothetical protein [Austropuccinia psidii MF-1]
MLALVLGLVASPDELMDRSFSRLIDFHVPIQRKDVHHSEVALHMKEQRWVTKLKQAQGKRALHEAEEVLAAAVAAINAEPLPTTKEGRENYFMEQVGMGETLASSKDATGRYASHYRLLQGLQGLSISTGTNDDLSKHHAS